MKVAYFSPLNPQPSGISDYSEELLPYLARYAEIDLFVDGFVPSNAELIRQFRYFDYSNDAQVLDRLSSYDAVVYHMGNDHRYHTGIARVMLEHPGIAVFHDFALQDFFLGQAHTENNMGRYLDELEVCHGPTERRRAEEHVTRGGMPPHVSAPLSFPLNARLARAAEGIIVHSEWSRRRLAEIAPTVPITRINHHITAHAAATPVSIKKGSGPVMIASFGLITPDKGIERALSALATLRNDCDFRYTLVGPAGNFPGLNELVRHFGLEDLVSVTGFVSLEEFEKHIASTDIAINLRERPVGATSGSLCRIMAAAVPAIVSNVGAFSELPDSAVVKIDHDDYAPALLRAYLRKLIEDQDLRRRIGENARNHVVAYHKIESSAEHYVAFLRKVIDARPRKQIIESIAGDVTSLGMRASNEALLRGISSEVALLMPETVDGRKRLSAEQERAPSNGNGNATAPPAFPKVSPTGRIPKLEGIDYKRAAVEYLSKLNPERHHHLRTKPFYNLANKPAKYQSEGMDEDMHRHFCDFANMAVTLAVPAGARILDVGCGSGWLSEYFARLGYNVKGIDISPDLIEMSRERVARVPYGVDHETPLRCEFQIHDIELEPLKEKFDVIICYDSLHHFEDERAVITHLAAMLDMGGLLFILEGQKPPDDSTTADELRGVMKEFGTLESPFSVDYLRALLTQNGFSVVGDYVSVNGLFEREMLEGTKGDPRLPLGSLPIDYHYLTCMKVTEKGSAANVPDSKSPAVLQAEISLRDATPVRVKVGEEFQVAVSVTNKGDTVWLTGQSVRAGLVMPGVRIMNSEGETVSERHGHPMLPRAVAPGQTVELLIECVAPTLAGTYSAKIDLVDQHVCWFEERGSTPLIFTLTVDANT
jgi:2-polyprenyl-3-methyl-5-hydroxy-6-metoxy-1,4-benzoquinol methylase/glycosyltransferase involved in cell wall biosynthesis